MGRMIGYMANRTDRLADALAEERAAVGEDAHTDADAWGMGFYQGGEVLHKKRPRGEGRERLEWRDFAGNVRTDCAIIHFRTATVGDYRSENTHPFRMRQWLFAHNGTVHGWDAVRDALVQPMPDFLARNIRGTTDSEHVFHALLSFLHDAGHLENPDPEPKIVLSALRSTISLVDRLVGEIGAPPATLNLLLTNGRSLFAVRRGGPVHYVSRSVGGDGPNRPGSLSYAMVVANGPEAPPDWKAVPESHALVVGRDLSVSTTAL